MWYIRICLLLNKIFLYKESQTLHIVLQRIVRTEGDCLSAIAADMIMCYNKTYL